MTGITYTVKMIISDPRQWSEREQFALTLTINVDKIYAWADKKNI